jgi:hypothetical protein
MTQEIANAITTLKNAMRTDPEYAWAWHCNLAMPIMDAYAPASNASHEAQHQAANEAAAHLMQHLFDYDITTDPRYAYGKSGAQAYAEMRIEAERLEVEAP